MIKKEAILKVLEEASLVDVEVIQEDEDMALIRFWYQFDQEELAAAQSFADSEDDIDELEDEGEEIDLDSLLDEEEFEEEEEDLLYDEEEEYYDDPKLKYLAEIAIDYVGETLESIRDDFELEVQYVGYHPTQEHYAAYEFVALVFDKNKALNIEEILDELDI